MTDVKELWKGHRVVVQAPLLAQVVLEVLLGGKLHAGELLQGIFNRRLCKMLLT